MAGQTAKLNTFVGVLVFGRGRVGAFLLGLPFFFPFFPEELILPSFPEETETKPSPTTEYSTADWASRLQFLIGGGGMLLLFFFLRSILVPSACSWDHNGNRNR
jgi:hypothetical protein